MFQQKLAERNMSLAGTMIKSRSFNNKAGWDMKNREKHQKS